MLPSSDDYSFDRFIIKGGVRLRTGMRRTIMPAEHETNARFEQRMLELGAQLEQMDGVISVELVLERRAGHFAQCAIEISTEPRPIAVLEDGRPAGGHFGGGRGARGSGLAAALPTSRPMPRS